MNILGKSLKSNTLTLNNDEFNSRQTAALKAAQEKEAEQAKPAIEKITEEKPVEKPAENWFINLWIYMNHRIIAQ